MKSVTLGPSSSYMCLSCFKFHALLCSFRKVSLVSGIGVGHCIMAMRRILSNTLVDHCVGVVRKESLGFWMEEKELVEM